MLWTKGTFIEGMKDLLKAFEDNPTKCRLALLWRAPDEFRVSDEWILGHIKGQFDGSTLRVVMWLTREEATDLVSVFREVK